MPPMPGPVKQNILRGLYRFQEGAEGKKHRIQLFGSGSILRCVLKAAEILAEKYDVSADVWSVTSYKELRRDALNCERHNRLHPADEPKIPYITRALEKAEGPVVAASDYMTLVQDQISRWIPNRFVCLGTDGFGMSDTREALRRHFEVDAECIVLAALDGLRMDGKIEASVVVQAFEDLGVDPEKIAPISI